MKESTYKHYDELPLFLSAAMVARVLGISTSSSYALLHSKGFPTLRVGGRMAVPRRPVHCLGRTAYRRQQRRMKLFGNGCEMLSVCPPLAPDFRGMRCAKGGMRSCETPWRTSTTATSPPATSASDRARRSSRYWTRRSRGQEQLAAKLDAEGKALLHRMAYAENEASSTIALENFILGFRPGDAAGC